MELSQLVVELTGVAGSCTVAGPFVTRDIGWVMVSCST